MRISRIEAIDSKDLHQWLSEGKTRREILELAGLSTNSGSNFLYLNRRLQREGLSDKAEENAYIKRSNALRANGKRAKIPQEELFVRNSKSWRSVVRRRVIKDKLIPYRCAICDHPPEWRGKPLSLVLDHINGVPDDNRLKNLRFLCPHCDNQTDTFCGKNVRVWSNGNSTSHSGWEDLGSTPSTRAIKACIDCSKTISRQATRCRSCASKGRQPFKVDWPSIEELKQMIRDTNYSSVGRQLGVSDVAVRKHVKVYDKRR